MLATLLDFSQPGELGAITDEATLRSMAEMDALGAVDASELARTFSTDDSVRFINGVLDAVRRTLTRE